MARVAISGRMKVSRRGGGRGGMGSFYVSSTPAPIVAPLATFYQGYAHLGTAWTAADSSAFTLAAEVRMPALPVFGYWTLVGVGSLAGAAHARAFLNVTAAGEITVTCRNVASAGGELLAGVTTNAGLVPGTRYIIHAAVDAAAASNKIRIGVNGAWKTVSLTIDNTGGSGTTFDWSGTGPGGNNGSRRCTVGIQRNAFTGTLWVPSTTVGYIDGGSGDVPVEIGQAFFYSQAAITDLAVFTSHTTLNAYASLAELIMGRTTGYVVADWIAGVNDGVGADLTVV